MKKLPSWFKRRWHGIPVGLVSVLLALALVGGGAFAAYTVFAGNANVTVNEALTISNTGNDGGEGFTGQPGNYVWDVSLYPGQSKSLNVLVSNAAPNALTIGAVGTASQDVQDLGVSASWSGAGSVAGNSSEVLTLTVAAAEDASPGGPYTIYFQISRG